MQDVVEKIAMMPYAISQNTFVVNKDSMAKAFSM